MFGQKRLERLRIDHAEAKLTFEGVVANYKVLLPGLNLRILRNKQVCS